MELELWDKDACMLVVIQWMIMDLNQNIELFQINNVLKITSLEKFMKVKILTYTVRA